MTPLGTMRPSDFAKLRRALSRPRSNRPKCKPKGPCFCGADRWKFVANAGEYANLWLPRTAAVYQCIECSKTCIHATHHAWQKAQKSNPKPWPAFWKPAQVRGLAYAIRRLDK